MFHLEILHKVKIGEHSNCTQRSFHVCQLKVAEVEVGEFEGLCRWYNCSLAGNMKERQRENSKLRGNGTIFLSK